MGFMRAPAVTVLAQSGTAASVTGTTDETTLATITIPAGAMGEGGQIDIEELWSYTNSANNKSLRTRFGGTVVQAANYTTTATNQLHVRVSNRTTSSQVAAASSGTGFGSSTGAIVTAAIDTTAAVSITLTGQLANAAETITLESYTVRLIR